MTGKVEVKTVKTDSFEMRYAQFGSGSASFVILPGLSIKSVLDSAPAVAEAYGIFTRDYTVYLFDRRSDLPEKYTVAQMAEDTARAMEEIGLENVDLFGVSQGGMIAQLIAAGRPGLVRRLVLGSTASRVDGVATGGWSMLAKSGDAVALTDEFCRAVYSEEFYKMFGGLFTAMAESVSQEDLKRFSILADGICGFDAYDRLEEIKCPTLVIGAELDRVTPAAESRAIAEKLGCSLFIYGPPYGHAVYDEAPDYKERILSFLCE